MAWWAYVQRHSDGATNARIAESVGITPPSVGRWSKPGARPDPVQAAAFARAYGRPVLEAFIAAGFLTAEEAGERPTAPPSLATLSDDELLAEVRRRMEGGQQRWLDTGGPEDDDDGGGDVIDFPGQRPPATGRRAARSPDSAPDEFDT